MWSAAWRAQKADERVRARGMGVRYLFHAGNGREDAREVLDGGYDGEDVADLELATRVLQNLYGDLPWQELQPPQLQGVQVAVTPHQLARVQMLSQLAQAEGTPHHPTPPNHPTPPQHNTPQLTTSHHTTPHHSTPHHLTPQNTPQHAKRQKT